MLRRNLHWEVVKRKSVGNLTIIATLSCIAFVDYILLLFFFPSFISSINFSNRLIIFPVVAKFEVVSFFFFFLISSIKVLWWFAAFNKAYLEIFYTGFIFEDIIGQFCIWQWHYYFHENPVIRIWIRIKFNKISYTFLFYFCGLNPRTLIFVIFGSI